MDIKELKQQYLRENILEKNYDAEEFMDFCESHYGSVDIDAWSFDQLKKIVQHFITDSKKQFNFQTDFSNSKPISPEITNEFGHWNNFIEAESPKKQTNNFQLNLLDLDFLEGMGKGPSTTTTTKVEKREQKKPQKKQQKNNENKFMSVPSDIAKKLQEGNSNFIAAYNPSAFEKVEEKPQEKQFKQPPKFQQQLKEQPVIQSFKSNNFRETVQCKKAISKCRLTGKQQILVNGHEIINPNIFVPKYVLYTLTINPLNIEVKRRMKDFQNLRNLLVKFFPSTQIPHLERSSSRLSETEPQSIKKQILFIQSFLNSIMMNPQLKCKLLEEFLMCKDLDLMKKIFKEYEKLKKPQSIETLFTSTGNIQVNLSSDNEKYLEKQRHLNEFLRENFNKLKGLYDDLIQGFANNVKILNNISEIFYQVKDKTKGINQQFKSEYQNPQLDKQLDRIAALHKQWSQSFKTQASIIESQIRHLCRYERDNSETLAQIYKLQAQIHETYVKRSQRQQLIKQPYQSKKLNDYKLSLEDPSKNLTVLKYQAGYFQEQCCRESQRFLNELSSKMAKKFHLFCTLQLNIERDMETVWKDFDSFYL